MIEPLGSTGKGPLLDEEQDLLLDKLPKPQPDQVFYNNEKEAALKKPACRSNYEKFSTSPRASEVAFLPVKLDFENVSRCNFRCIKCQVKDWPGQKRAADMTLESFKRIIDSLPGLLEIKLQGMGEPLLGGENFFRMIQYARAKHIWVRTTTNASLLHLGDNYRRLIDADPCEVQISIDGTSKGTFENIRKGADFNVILKNCKLINQYSQSRGLVRTRMWTCLQQQNFHEFSDFVDLAAAAGFQRLSFALNLHGWGQDKYLNDNLKVGLGSALSYDLAMAAVEKGSSMGIHVSFWNNISKYRTHDHASLCPWPFERAFISSDMRIVPCCMIANPDVFELGDAYHFNEIWLGDRYSRFREMHLAGTIPPVCQPCYKQ